MKFLSTFFSTIHEIPLFRKKEKVSIVCWNLSNSAFGQAVFRAHSLRNKYKVEIVGPIFPEFGHQVWKPLRDNSFHIKYFKAKHFPEFYDQVKKFVATLDKTDRVVICSTRLPSLIIGLELAKRDSAKILVDIPYNPINEEDIPGEEFSKIPLSNLQIPYGDNWTRYGEILQDLFPVRTFFDSYLNETSSRKENKYTAEPHLKLWRKYRSKLRNQFGLTHQDRVVVLVKTSDLIEAKDIDKYFEQLSVPSTKIFVQNVRQNDFSLIQLTNHSTSPIVLASDKTLKFNQLFQRLLIADALFLLKGENSSAHAYPKTSWISNLLTGQIPVYTFDSKEIEPLIEGRLLKLIKSTGDILPADWLPIAAPPAQAMSWQMAVDTATVNTQTTQQLINEVEKTINKYYERQSALLLAKKNAIDHYIESLEVPQLESTPWVSIIILTRDGHEHLERLFQSMQTFNNYDNLEILLVDNASTRPLRPLLDKFPALPVRIIRNEENKNFSEGNNMAAKQAKGELLLLLNDDIEVTHGWLHRLLHYHHTLPNVGIIGARMIYPIKPYFANSLKVQHAGIDITTQDTLRAFNIGKGDELDMTTPPYTKVLGVTGACMLIAKDLYFKVGGLDERYNYGYEDVDLCLLISCQALNNYLVNNCVLYHHEFGSQKSEDTTETKRSRTNNRTLLTSKMSSYSHHLN